MGTGKDHVKTRRDVGKILEIIIGIVFLCILDYPMRDLVLQGHNDFSTFYAGAKLAHTPALYDHKTMSKLVHAGWPDSPDEEAYIRAPFYAVLLKPLAAFDYHTALKVFLCLTFACFLWFVIRFSRGSAELPVLAAFSIPMFLNINGGTDVPFLLPVLGGFLLLSRRGRDFAAGLVLALCAIKFHLFILLPFLLLLRKKWRMLLGAGTGTAVLTVLGGVSLIGPWLKTIFSPQITELPVWKLSPSPNIHGLVVVSHAGSIVETLLVGLVIALFIWACLRVENFELVLATTLVCGLLVSYHSYTYDDLLLMPVLVLVSPFRALRNIVGLALTPIAYLAAFAGGFYSTILPLMLLGFLGTFWYLNRAPAMALETRRLVPETLTS